MADNGINNYQNSFNTLAAEVFEQVYETMNEKFPGYHAKPFQVMYGTLGVEENRKRGGSPKSFHLVGQAMDIRTQPNTDERKCIYATIAEYACVKRGLGSEIAVDWGLAGHVHFAINREPVHKRFSMNKGEVWTTGCLTNITSLKNVIRKNYRKPDDPMDSLDIDRLSGESLHRDLDKQFDQFLQTANYRSEGDMSFILDKSSEISTKLDHLITSPVINWKVLSAVDEYNAW